MNNRKHWNGVLVIAPANGRGGIASVVKLHAQTTAWKAMECKLLSTYDDRSLWKKVLMALQSCIRAIPLLPRARIVHIHLAAQKSVMRKLPFILGAKLFRKPLVIHVHAFSAESLFDETPLGMGKLVLQLADCVVALSESWRDAMRMRDKNLQITVIANPVMVSSVAFLPKKSITPVILFAGRLELRKGYQDLLAAAARILKKFPEAKFWFAGHGDLVEASLIAQSLGIENSIELMGWIDVQKMESLYHAANIFCLPSYQEGLPMVVLEAMGNGLPVVCTKVGGLPDYIEDGWNGLYAIPGDSISIANSIIHLITHPEEARMIGQRASDLIRARCGLSEISHRLEDLYDNLLGKDDAKHLATRHCDEA